MLQNNNYLFFMEKESNSATTETASSSVSFLLDLESDEDVFKALAHLSEYYPETNDEQSRHNLLGNIERKSLQTHRQFLESFGAIHNQLQQVENAVKTMRNTCDHMQERLNQTNTTASRVITSTQSLQEKRLKTQEKQTIVQKYLDQFLLTEAERSLLTNQEKDEDLSIEFFRALKRVQQISNNAKKYLLEKYSHAEIAIKDSLSITQQAAYSKLYSWIQSKFKTFYDTTPEITEEMRLAIQSIHERPVFLQHSLKEIIDVRATTVHDAFINALERGGPNGIPKPIEIHAHDPFRYVSDMLGCIHQLLASEYEILYTLFIGEPGTKVQNSDQTNVVEYKSKMDFVLSGTFDKICNPFEIRLEQALLLQPGPVVLFKIANLLDFYERTVTKMIPEKSPFVKLCGDCKRKTMNEFNDTIIKQSSQLLEEPPKPPITLSPPSVIHQILNNLMEIMAIFDSSLVPVEERQQEFTPHLLAFLEPLVKTCTLSATFLDNEPDMAVFMVNCLGLIQNSLAGFSFSSAKAEELQGQIDAHMETLVTEEARYILQTCKLGAKLEIFRDWDNESKDSRQPLSYVSQMDARQLSSAMRSFEEALLDISTTVSYFRFFRVIL